MTNYFRCHAPATGAFLLMVQAETERELVAALRDGSADAFDRIYEAWRPRVFSFLIRLSKERGLAEEILQETFVRLAKRAGDLREDTRLGPWLFTVARNLWVSHLRIVMLDAERLDRLSLEGVAPVPTPFDRAAANDTQARLERALAELPEAQREVLLLVGVEGLEPSEAAAVVGIAPEALRQRLSRARSALRKALERAGDPGQTGGTTG